MSYQTLFLQQSYRDCTKQYEEILHNPNLPLWDYVVLTASNEAQAQAYRAQISYRLKHQMLPEKTHYAVLPDPDGKRVGSGGATLNVLRYIREHAAGKQSPAAVPHGAVQGDGAAESRQLASAQPGEAACHAFDGKRILVIHSGGDSKRVPQYSACGKLFSPVPRILPNGRRSTPECLSAPGMCCCCLTRFRSIFTEKALRRCRSRSLQKSAKTTVYTDGTGKEMSADFYIKRP